MAGIRGKHLDFFNFVKQYEIFCLLETFVETNSIDLCTKYFEGFRLFWIPAIRLSNFGRAKGGIVMGIKFNVSAEHIIVQGKNLVKISLGGRDIFILFAYLSGGNELEWERDYMGLKHFLYEHCSGKQIILMGDLNARTAKNQDLPEQLDAFLECGCNFSNERSSKDHVINMKGKLVLELCEDNNLVILNGRIEGDRCGEYTYLGPSGSSVIDYCCADLKALDLIESFKVGAEVFSDHMPLELNLYIGLKPEGVNTLPLLPKLKWVLEKEPIYKNKLQISSEEVSALPLNVQQAGEILSGMIYAAAGYKHGNEAGNNNSKRNSYSRWVYKNQWFDKECALWRTKVFKLLNLYRKSSSTVVKSEYCKVLDHYKRLRKNKELGFYSNILDNFKNVKDTKSFWDAAKVFKTKKFQCDPNIRSEVWSNYFHNLLNTGGICDSFLYAAPCVVDPILDREVCLDELIVVLKKCKSNKAPGPDRIPNEFYKYAPDNFLRLIVEYFNRVKDNCSIPDAFRRSIIFPVHKKGDISSVNNYRGISFMNVVAKLFNSLLLIRLEEWVYTNNILNESQAGFRKGYSTIDNLFNLVSTVDLTLKNKGKKLYCFFVDYKAAFDNINRDALFYKLYNTGLSYKFMTVLMELYRDTTARVWCKEGLSSEFETSNGVKQGCPLSALIFALFLNDLYEELGGGVRLSDLVIRILLYADDLVILATDPGVLQHMINNLKRYSEKWGLTVNLVKSKIMIFRRGGRLSNREQWRWGGEKIEIVNKFKYLGVTLTPRLSWKEHAVDRVSTTKFVMNNLWGSFCTNNKAPISAKWAIYNAVFKSIMGYGAPVWGYKNIDEFEVCQRYVIKKLFMLPLNMPNYMIYLETGVNLLWQQFFSMNINYVSKALKLPQHRLPRKLAELTILNNVGWYRGWRELAAQYNILLTNRESWPDDLNLLLTEFGIRIRRTWLERADRANFNTFYKSLSHVLGDRAYIIDDYDRAFISLIFRTRCGQLGLNNGPHKEEGCRNCSLCNLRHLETIEHFMGVCPVLAEIRRKWFGSNRLNECEVRNYLNGCDWRALVGYVREARKYRGWLIEQFNY